MEKVKTVVLLIVLILCIISCEDSIITSENDFSIVGKWDSGSSILEPYPGSEQGFKYQYIFKENNQFELIKHRYYKLWYSDEWTLMGIDTTSGIDDTYELKNDFLILTLTEEDHDDNIYFTNIKKDYYFCVINEDSMYWYSAGIFQGNSQDIFGEWIQLIPAYDLQNQISVYDTLKWNFSEDGNASKKFSPARQNCENYNQVYELLVEGNQITLIEYGEYTDYYYLTYKINNNELFLNYNDISYSFHRVY